MTDEEKVIAVLSEKCGDFRDPPEWIVKYILFPVAVLCYVAYLPSEIIKHLKYRKYMRRYVLLGASSFDGLVQADIKELFVYVHSKRIMAKGESKKFWEKMYLDIKLLLG
jgi:hypothetical protein